MKKEPIVVHPKRARRLKNGDLIQVVGTHAPSSIEWLKVVAVEHDYDGDGSTLVETEEGHTLYFYGRHRMLIGRA
jgi:hypothetical protein